jgi:hypothetical protein
LSNGETEERMFGSSYSYEEGHAIRNSMWLFRIL